LTEISDPNGYHQLCELFQISAFHCQF
jgi:hypothetical protein